MKFATLCVILTILVHAAVANHELDYGVMIDGGSSGTRAHIFKWPHRENNHVPLVDSLRNNITQAAITLRVNPGISTFSTNLAGIPAYLAPLVTFMQTNVPQEKWASTPLYFKGTAGLRLLPEVDQNAILDVVKTFFMNTTFVFNATDAVVMDAEEEGVFGWVSANYLLRNLDEGINTVGFMDMGGASTQLTFIPASPPVSNLYELILVGKNYSLYTTSYLGFGQDQAFLKYKNHIASLSSNETLDVPAACFLVGYNETFAYNTVNFNLYGTGNVVECLDTAVAILNLNLSCEVPNCGPSSAYIPAVFGNFYAVSGFYFTANFLFGASKLSNLTIDELLAGGSTYCETDWESANAAHEGENPAFLKQYCFNAMYHGTLLKDSYKFETSEVKITFVSQINGTDVGWPLGAMIYEASLLPYYPNPVESTTGSMSSGEGTTTGDSSSGAASTTGDSSSGEASTTGSAPASTTGAAPASTTGPAGSGTTTGSESSSAAQTTASFVIAMLIATVMLF